eukprot:15475196-Alexandrium_andersonii.AAC.1
MGCAESPQEVNWIPPGLQSRGLQACEPHSPQVPQGHPATQRPATHNRCPAPSVQRFTPGARASPEG